jgi:hypothetical protein
MPTISQFFGIVIQMFWREHAPPHFQALYGEHEALIDIRTLAVIGVASLGAPSASRSNGRSIIAKR